jgi:hypothetical protein
MACLSCSEVTAARTAVARKAGVPAEWVQEVIDEHFGGPKGRASGKLARKMRRLEERAASEREGKK